MSKRRELERTRNIGIIAHIDAGKTTTTERILYYTGASHQIGDVDRGNTVTDWMEQEKERGITITAATISCEWRGHRINIIDTPGHVDFTAEVERALRVLDGAVVILDAVCGVEPQSEAVWNQARRYHIPRIVVVNKMDRLGADFEGAVADVRKKLHTGGLPIQWPIGVEDGFVGVVDLITDRAVVWDADELGAEYRILDEIPALARGPSARARAALIEAVAAEDVTLLERYLAGERLAADDLKPVLRRLVLAGVLTPILCTAAVRNRGVQPVLDAIVEFLPAPFEVPQPVGRGRRGEEISRDGDPDEPLTALVFKTFTDADRRRLNYVRVYSGRIEPGDRIRNASRDQVERVARLHRMQADRPQKIEDLSAGEIGVIVGLKHATTGDTLCGIDDFILLERVTFPEPVVSAALEARKSGEEEKIQGALEMLALDDPTFRVKIDENTGERIISGMGELHLEVIATRLEREFHLAVRLGKPQVEYRETITRPARAESSYARTIAGRDHSARVDVGLEPLPAGTGNRFGSRATQPGVERFQSVIEQAAMSALEGGVIGGYRVLDVGVILLEVEIREETASEMAFAAATRNAVKDALRSGEPALLEPIMRLEIVTPREFTGGILAGLAARRGKVDSAELKAGRQIITARVPLSQMFGYTTDLRSASQGRATYSMHFDRFDRVDA